MYNITSGGTNKIRGYLLQLRQVPYTLYSFGRYHSVDPGGAIQPLLQAPFRNSREAPFSSGGTVFTFGRYPTTSGVSFGFASPPIDSTVVTNRLQEVKIRTGRYESNCRTPGQSACHSDPFHGPFNTFNDKRSPTNTTGVKNKTAHCSYI